MKFHVGYTRNTYLKEQVRKRVPITTIPVEADSFTAAAVAAKKNGRVIVFVDKAVGGPAKISYSRSFVLVLIRELDATLAQSDARLNSPAEKKSPEKANFQKMVLAKKAAPSKAAPPKAEPFKRFRVSFAPAGVEHDDVMGIQLFPCQHKEVKATSRAAVLKLYDTKTRVVFTISELGRPGVKATLLKDEMTKANILRGRKRTLASIAAETQAAVNTAVAELEAQVAQLAAEVETSTPSNGNEHTSAVAVKRLRVKPSKPTTPALPPPHVDLTALHVADKNMDGLLDLTENDEVHRGGTEIPCVQPQIVFDADSDEIKAMESQVTRTLNPYFPPITITQRIHNAWLDFGDVLKATFPAARLKKIAVWFFVIFFSLTLWTLLVGAVLGLYIRHGISMNGSELPTWVRLVYDL